MLIYAKGEEEPAIYRIGNPHRYVDVRALDLSATPENILGQVETIATAIRGFRSKVFSPMSVARSLF